MVKFFSRFSKRKEIPIEESIDKIQNGDTQLQNEILEQFTPFIAKTVSTICKRYINEYDDEFSVGLIAFNEALERYTPEKGRSITSFAETVIRSRVIDYIRKEHKGPEAFSFSPQDNDLNDDSGEYTKNNIEINISIDEYNKDIEKKQRQEEISKFQYVLSEFGLDFTDLFNQAPKHIDARHNAIDVAEKLIQTEELRNIFFTTKKLPIKDLDKLVSVSRKTIERNRKYIISLAIILDGDYKFLKEYLKK